MKERLPSIALGYVAAVAVTSVLLVVLMFYTLRYFGDADDTPQWLYTGLVLAFWAVVLTLIPCGLFIAAAERWSLRNLLVYEAFGAALPVPLAWGFDSGFFIETCAIGAAAGFTYWAVAGRKAGLPDKPAA